VHRTPPPFDEATVTATLAASPVHGLVAAWLFGSAAAGRLHAESDVDVGVLLDWQALPTAADRFEVRLALSGDVSAALGDRLVDVVVLNDVSPLFARRVVLEGRRLLCRDAQAEHDFRRDVQLQAIDLEPFVARSRRRALEALAR
jgi:predicted nucleotidyltransferase